MQDGDETSGKHGHNSYDLLITCSWKTSPSARNSGCFSDVSTIVHNAIMNVANGDIILVKGAVVYIWTWLCIFDVSSFIYVQTVIVRGTLSK